MGKNTYVRNVCTYVNVRTSNEATQTQHPPDAIFADPCRHRRPPPPSTLAIFGLSGVTRLPLRSLPISLLCFSRSLSNCRFYEEHSCRRTVCNHPPGISLSLSPFSLFLATQISKTLIQSAAVRVI